MKRVIIIMLVIIIGGAFLYADEGNGAGDQSASFTEETLDLWDELLDIFGGADFVEFETENGEEKLVIQLTTFVSENKGVILEKIVVNGIVTYHLAVYNSTYMGYFHIEQTLQTPIIIKMYLTAANGLKYFIPLSEQEAILNEMIKASNRNGVKINNNLLKDVYKRIFSNPVE